MGNKLGKTLKEYWFVPVSAIIVLLIIASGYRLCFTIGESMMPTLQNGESLLLNTHNKNPERFDVIVFNNSEEGILIKRVIGLPGENIKVINDTIYINGTPVDDPVICNTEDWGLLKSGITLAENEYLALGDNRNESYDCRFFGPLKQDDIAGVIKCRIPSFTEID